MVLFEEQLIRTALTLTLSPWERAGVRGRYTHSLWVRVLEAAADALLILRIELLFVRNRVST